MFFFKRKPKPFVSTFVPNYFLDHSWTKVRCVGCGVKNYSALNVNGTCIPSCGGVKCNLQAIATAGSI